MSSGPAIFRDWRAYRIICAEAPIRPIRGVAPDTLLSALGFDSIQFVALCVALEEAFAAPLPCDAIGDARTAGDLVAIVGRAAAAAHPSLPQTESTR